MGYDIRIGNAIPYFHKDKEDFALYSGWAVEKIIHPDAPSFPNDDMTGKSNCRAPSYTAWKNFCVKAKIVDVFYDESGRFRGGHPGCFILKKSDLEKIRESRKNREIISNLPPGFNEDEKEEYDGVLARLIWIEWWMDWALTNCETPAIENS